VTECVEKIFRETQGPAPTRSETAIAEIDALTTAVGQVTLASCEGPTIEIKTVGKNGYEQSETPVNRLVYVCNSDGYVQQYDYYYRKDKMPDNQG
jgi:hypothetical protein